MFKSRKAEMGIGTLIIFVSLIFVAATAAHVLIKTTTSLQNKALETGKAAQKSVSTRLEFITVTGDDGTDHDLENFYVQAKLSPGSEDMDLTNLVLSVDLSDSTASLLYSSEDCTNVTDASGNGFYTDGANENGTFTISYIKSKDDGHVDGYLLRGEMVKICFSAPRSVQEDEEFSIKVVPRLGFATEKKLLVDSVVVKKNVMLFP